MTQGVFGVRLEIGLTGAHQPGVGRDVALRRLTVAVDADVQLDRTTGAAQQVISSRREDDSGSEPGDDEGGDVEQ